MLSRRNHVPNIAAGCSKTYTNPKLTVCPICGTKLVRKAASN